MSSIEKRLQAIIETADAKPWMGWDDNERRVARLAFDAGRLYERKRLNGKILHAQLNQALAPKRARKVSR